MKLSNTRTVAVASGLALALCFAPAEGRADLLYGWFGPTYTTYRPIFGSACNTCQPQTACYAPQTCNYVPQTCYRTVTVNVPVTTYQPVATCDPCSGCATTCLRPVTTFVAQCRQVPYLSFRPLFGFGCRPACAPVCATGGCATGGCGTVAYGAGGCATGACGVTASYAPAAMAPAAPGCCAPAATATTTFMPAPGAASLALPQSSTVLPPATTGPPVSQPHEAAQQPPLQPIPKTFEEGPENNGKEGDKQEDEDKAPSDDGDEQAAPQGEGKNSSSGLFRGTPVLRDPRDRTTLRTAPRWEVRPAVHFETVAPKAKKAIDADGWRPARSR